MTNKEKNLIEKAVILEDENEMFNLNYKYIYIINSGKLYDGFWGKNDYKSIIVLALDINDRLINISRNYQCDTFEIKTQYEFGYPRFDIPKDENCFRIFLQSKNYVFKLQNALSDISFEVINNAK